MTEKRKFLRFNSSLPIKIASGFSGKTIDLSEMGLSFVLEKPLSSSNAQIKIEFSPKEVIDIEVKVIWNKEKEGKFTYGTSFVKLKEADMLFVKEQLTKSKFEPLNELHNLSSLPVSSAILDQLRPSALSVDVNNLCNLKCKHCFWDSYKENIRTPTNINIIESVKLALNRYPSLTNITWYGGEPLIDKESLSLVKNGIKLNKKNNLVITNGCFPIHELGKNTHFAASIDGVKEVHDKIRGVNVYDRTKKNIISAISRKIPIAIIYCINAINIDCIPDFLKEWSDKGTIGIVFTAYAPIKGKDSYLNLSVVHRENAVDLLLDMKKKYNKLICNTETMIELIRSKYGKDLANDCPMNIFNKHIKVYSIHMCNDSSIRIPCALGKYADCLQCRSVTKLALYAGMVLRDKKSFFALLRMYHSQPYSKKKGK